MRTWERIKLLVTGKAQWCDAVTGAVIDNEVLDWRTRWAIAGIHSYNWDWVHRYGRQDCGCTINPVTRRRVLYNMDCLAHCSLARACSRCCPCEDPFDSDDDDDS